MLNNSSQLNLLINRSQVAFVNQWIAINICKPNDLKSHLIDNFFFIKYPHVEHVNKEITIKLHLLTKR